MTDRPIIFSSPMVRALLDGRKTQTRRVIKPRLHTSLFDGSWSDEYVLDPGNASWRAEEVRYAAGDRLWVRETWAVGSIYDGMKPRDINPDGRPGWCGIRYAATDERCGIKDRVSLFMPRWASRLTLIVTDVRVERLNDISEADAAAEGLIKLPASGRFVVNRGEQYAGLARHTARARFADLWAGIHGPDAWTQNPWVAAITFSILRANIDSLPTSPPEEIAQDGERS